ncbi:hypothetical protein COB72_04635 [bacterium]|nr:MAG: hypothetical protein COB72_04635 [bacterium]
MHCILEQTDHSSSASLLLEQGDPQAIFAHMLDPLIAWVGNDPSEWIEACESAQRIVVPCGRQESDGDEHAASLLASWSQAGWAQFDENVLQLDQQMNEAKIELMIRPSSSGMLSDAICTMAWARRSEDLGCSLMLDPIGWIVESMLRDVSDHLSRINDLCVGCEKIGAVMIRSVRHDQAGVLVESSIGEGEIDSAIIADRLGGLIRWAIDAGKPIVVHNDADLKLLGL